MTAVHGGRGAPPPTLFATPATAAALEGAGAVAFLIGSYDGSGNFGDIAQLDAALGLLAPLEPDLLVLAVIERACERDHRLAVEQMRNPPRHTLSFGDAAHEDDLVPVTPPRGLTYAVHYLYGGGYLNPDWGDRKLAMLGAAEALAVAGGAVRIDRVSSGLQVDPDWLASMAGADQRVLRAFALHGGRDRRSSEALAGLEAGGEVIESGDDAIGSMPLRAAAAPEPSADRLRVNVHFAEHKWVTDDPAAMLRFQAGFLAELGRLAGEPPQVQPLLAYVDSRSDERPGLDRLAGACAAQGIELLEPLLLRPADLGSSARELSLAQLTLSCSYHASLASLMLGVPAILIEDNAYYEQKAAGLRRDFGLPPELAASSDQDPATAARRAHAAIGGEAGALLRGALAVAGATAVGRRASAEAAIASRLAAGALGARAAVEAEPAVRRELAAAAAQATAAQQQAAAAHSQLAVLVGSRSWRLTEPLRRGRAELRRMLRARAGRGRR